MGKQAAGGGAAEGSGLDAAPPGARGGGEGGDEPVLSGEGTEGKGRPRGRPDGEREGRARAKGSEKGSWMLFHGRPFSSPLLSSDLTDRLARGENKMLL